MADQDFQSFKKGANLKNGVSMILKRNKLFISAVVLSFISVLVTLPWWGPTLMKRITTQAAIQVMSADSEVTYPKPNEYPKMTEEQITAVLSGITFASSTIGNRCKDNPHFLQWIVDGLLASASVWGHPNSIANSFQHYNGLRLAGQDNLRDCAPSLDRQFRRVDQTFNQVYDVTIKKLPRSVIEKLTKEEWEILARSIAGEILKAMQSQ